MRSAALCGALLLLIGWSSLASAQMKNDPLSQAEVESLRDASYIPLDRLAGYEKILDTREKSIEDELKRSGHPDFAGDMHDLLDQFGSITDELNDNLTELDGDHRDLRKGLPKLVAAAERWATVLRSPPPDDHYSVVRKIALDNLKDLREEAEQMQASEAAFFTAHPEAAKAEKNRLRNPHAPD